MFLCFISEIMPISESYQFSIWEFPICKIYKKSLLGQF